MTKDQIIVAGNNSPHVVGREGYKSVEKGALKEAQFQVTSPSMLVHVPTEARDTRGGGHNPIELSIGRGHVTCQIELDLKDPGKLGVVLD